MKILQLTLPLALILSSSAHAEKTMEAADFQAAHEACHKLVKTACLGVDFDKIKSCMEKAVIEAGESGVACRKFVKDWPVPSAEMKVKFEANKILIDAACKNEKKILNMRSALDLIDVKGYIQQDSSGLACIAALDGLSKSREFPSMMGIGKTCRADIDQSCLFIGVKDADLNPQAFVSCLEQNKHTYSESCKAELDLAKHDLKKASEGKIDSQVEMDQKLETIKTSCHRELKTFSGEEFMTLHEHLDRTSAACQTTLTAIEKEWKAEHHLNHELKNDSEKIIEGTVSQ